MYQEIMSASCVLTPGTNIKPIITLNECKSMFSRLYGLQSSNLEKLNGYDDINVRVTVDKNCNGNEYINKISDSGYILKIMNSFDSSKEDFVRGQNSLLVFLGERGVKCPNLVRNISGNYYSLEKLSSGYHIVRLMIFMPGRVLLGISYNMNLFYEVGKNIATIDLLLKDFDDPVYKTHKTIWMLDSIPELHKFLFAVEDERNKSIISNILSRFEAEILTNLDRFERGIIHGDCTENNILVEQHDDGLYHYSALLDFGDTSHGCYLFELAITMLYMMLLENDMMAGCRVLDGYNSVRKVTDLELDSLLLCISARLCQSLVLGAYTSRLDPENSSYLLITAKKGWDLLAILYEDEGDLTKMWRKTCE